MGEWDFYRDSMAFDYCLLPMTDFNITCLKICFPFVFFFLIFSFFFFVPLHQRVSIFLFLLFFPLTFPSTFFFFWVVYTNNKAQKESLWHKPLFEFLFILHGSIHFCIWCFSFYKIPLSTVSIFFLSFFFLSFFFPPYLFLFCVDIFKLFTQTQTLTNVFPKVFPFYLYYL